MAASASALKALQAWKILHRHARDDIDPLRLQELCQDNDRVSSLVAVHNSTYVPTQRHNRVQQQNQQRMLIVDVSRQRMTSDTLNHLLRLASARNIRGYIRQLAWGQNDPGDPVAGAAKADDRQATSAAARKQSSSSQQQRSHLERDGAQSMHIALRAPANQGLEMLLFDGSNALDGIHHMWNRIERLTNDVRAGRIVGFSGKILRDVVVVGRGVPVMALMFINEALRRDEDARIASMNNGNSDSGKQKKAIPPRRMRFVSSVDPVAAASAVDGLNPDSTIVVTVSLQRRRSGGNKNDDEEINLATKTIHKWLERGLLSSSKLSSTNNTNQRSSLLDAILKKHTFLVTTTTNNNESRNSRSTATAADNVFILHNHSIREAFTTFTAAGLLPLALVYGWNIVEQILAGGHDMDKHFVEMNPRHNIPILLGLCDIWNDAFMGGCNSSGSTPSSSSGGGGGRVITPFCEAFSAYPDFVAAMESQTCGGGRNTTGGVGQTNFPSAMVFNGGFHGQYDRMLYQGGRVVPSESIVAMDTQAGGENSASNHDALMCSFFAHADVLAFGNTTSATRSVTPKQSQNNEAENVAEGNRPSTLLLCGRCDAFTCGQLVALAEHRAVVVARLWDTDPFSECGGSTLREIEISRLKEKLQKLHLQGSEDDGFDNGQVDTKVNFATTTILSHYAKRVQQNEYLSQRG